MHRNSFSTTILMFFYSSSLLICNSYIFSVSNFQPRCVHFIWVCLTRTVWMYVVFFLVATATIPSTIWRAAKYYVKNCKRHGIIIVQIIRLSQWLDTSHRLPWWALFLLCHFLHVHGGIWHKKRGYKIHIANSILFKHRKKQQQQQRKILAEKELEKRKRERQ